MYHIVWNGKVWKRITFNIRLHVGFREIKSITYHSEYIRQTRQEIITTTAIIKTIWLRPLGNKIDIHQVTLDKIHFIIHQERLITFRNNNQILSKFSILFPFFFNIVANISLRKMHVNILKVSNQNFKLLEI